MNGITMQMLQIILNGGSMNLAKAKYLKLDENYFICQLNELASSPLL